MNNTLKKILVVDDEQDTVAWIEEKLSSKHYTVDIAYNGKEGFDKMRAMKESGMPYDLIILDFLIPALNGMEVCKEMRRDEILRKIPVLMISILPLESKEFQQSLERYDELKVIKGILQKPFTGDALLVQVKKLLEN